MRQLMRLSRSAAVFIEIWDHVRHLEITNDLWATRLQRSIAQSQSPSYLLPLAHFLSA